MSINGVGASYSTSMYQGLTQNFQSNSSYADTSSTSSILATQIQFSGDQSNDSMMSYASELGMRMHIQGQQTSDMGPPPPPPPEGDQGFSQDELSEMAAENSELSELFTALSENFEEADTDGDGVIKREEAMAYAQDKGIDMPAPPSGQAMGQVSASGFSQEQLSEMAAENSDLSELFTALSENFEEADTDGDGVIKAEEAMAYAESNGIDMPAPPSGQAVGQTSEPGLSQTQLSEIASSDASVSELFSALSDDFESADTNGDGVITADEAMTYAKNNDMSMPEPGERLSVSA